MTSQEFTHSDGQWIVAFMYCHSPFVCLILVNAQKAKTQTCVDVKDISSTELIREMDFSCFTFTPNKPRG